MLAAARPTALMVRPQNTKEIIEPRNMPRRTFGFIRFTSKWVMNSVSVAVTVGTALPATSIVAWPAWSMAIFNSST